MSNKDNDQESKEPDPNGDKDQLENEQEDKREELKQETTNQGYCRSSSHN
jgi:hypothetical protein